jgi:uncharacterized protein YdaL
MKVPNVPPRRPWRTALGLAAGLTLASCGGESLEAGHAGARRGRTMASAMINNPAPGAVTMPAPAALVGGSPSGAEAVRSALTVTGGPTQTLILYDTSGPWGALGELYAMGTANLVSHFGGYTTKPVNTYACGDTEAFTATIYLGSTYDEPLPPCLLDDVRTTTRPVLWSFFNVWKLVEREGYNAFVERTGWVPTALDGAKISEVVYKGRTLARYGANAAGVMNGVIFDPARVQVLAEAVRPDGSRFPWAIRTGNFTYLGEIPFSYMSEEDRYLAFADLLFDLLDPTRAERHRALVRIEDINPETNPAQLRAIADLLHGQGVPFGFGLSPEYLDPLGVYNGGVALTTKLKKNTPIVDAIKYMIARGGVLVLHGLTHQWSGAINPYTMVTGDDTEFYRTIENPDHSVTYAGPLPEDSVPWAKKRMTDANKAFQGATLPAAAIFEFPHYAASSNAYRAVAQTFTTRWDRTLYFGGTLTGQPANHDRMFGQMFPYVVKDVYGTKVLPENLGNVEPEDFYGYPARRPAQIIDAAARNLVVRDGVVGFYFHPFFDIELLRETVNGIRALGYTFVNPSTL